MHLPKFKSGVFHIGILAIVVVGLLATTAVITKANPSEPRIPLTKLSRTIQPPTLASDATCEVLSPSAHLLADLRVLVLLKFIELNPVMV